MTLNESFSELLEELVRERTGLAAERRDPAARARLVARAMARAGVRSEAAYLALVKRDAKVFDELIADLTVPESYFFRDPHHYDLLRGEILPLLCAENREDHVFEVWSAGCAGGEEPYSLAILFEQEHLAERTNVLGSDISRRALARADRATYSKWSMRATRDDEVARYFQVTDQGYRLIPRIRKRVRLLHHNLSGATYPRPLSRLSGFDLILCRNVLIYFEPKATAATAQRLAQCLGEHGVLLMGPSDPLLPIEAMCEVVPTAIGMMYRRRSGQVWRAPAPPEPLGLPERAPPARFVPERFTPPPVSAPPARSSQPSFATRAPGSSVRPLPKSVRPPSLPPRGHVPGTPPVERVRALVEDRGVRVGEVLCRELSLEHPLDVTLHFLHASLLIDLSEDDAAEAALRRVLYLDRSLLSAQLLSAGIAERRGALIDALRLYEQVGVVCRRAPPDAPVPLGDGLTHGALEALTTQRAQALRVRGARG